MIRHDSGVGRWLRIAVIALFVAASAAAVQFEAPRPHRSDLTYDGQFTFVRLRWGSDFGLSRRRGFSSVWNHDYPR